MRLDTNCGRGVVLSGEIDRPLGLERGHHYQLALAVWTLPEQSIAQREVVRIVGFVEPREHIAGWFEVLVKQGRGERLPRLGAFGGKRIMRLRGCRVASDQRYQ